MSLVIRPGDILLVCFERQVTLEESDRYKAALLQRIPDLRDVVLLSEVSSISAFRPGGEDEHATDLA